MQCLAVVVILVSVCQLLSRQTGCILLLTIDQLVGCSVPLSPDVMTSRSMCRNIVELVLNYTSLLNFSAQF